MGRACYNTDTSPTSGHADAALGEAQVFAFLPSSQVMLELLVWRPHPETHRQRGSKIGPQVGGYMKSPYCILSSSEYVWFSVINLKNKIK